MIATAFEAGPGTIPQQNVLLFLGLALSLGAAVTLVLGLDRVLNAGTGIARALYHRRRLWGWRLLWAAAVPTIGPLALITDGMVRADAAARHYVRVWTRWAGARRHAFRLLTGRPVRPA